MTRRILSLCALVALAALVGGCNGGGCQPKPQPDPVPIPVPDDGSKPKPVPVPPDPAPAPAVAGFVVVEDVAQAGQARGLFLASPKVSAFLKNSGLKHAIVSTGATDPDGKPVGGVAGALVADAKGKGTPRLYLLDAAGKTLKDLVCPLDPDAFVAVFAPKEHARAMGCTLAAPKLQWVRFGAAESPNTKLISRAEWKPVSLEAHLPPVYDQDGRGQCNASGTCSVLETAREIAGMGYVKLSAGDLYSQINGGRDQGSTLEDGLYAATHSGVATAQSVPYVWDGRNHGRDVKVLTERKSYRSVETLLCPTVEHVGSALQQGFPVVVGIMWYDNFTPDRNGVLPKLGRGGAGGHAFELYGMEPDPSVPGKWLFLMRNSWSVTWGMGGDAKLPENHLNGSISGFWAVGSVVRTPEPFPPASTTRRVRLELAPEFLLAP